jgi:molybdopterin-guanine dinucleotide biosynthesis protein A
MLSGLILAGGRSSRMGRDKAGLVLPTGATLMERQAGMLRKVGAGTLLASVRADGNYPPPGITSVWDAVADAGPLAGIAAGLQAAPAGLLMVLAVDMPAVEETHLRRLIELATPDCGVIPMQAGQCEPLAAIYPTTLADSAEAALKSGNRAVHAWARAEAEQGRLMLWETPADWAGVFRSWNTPSDVLPKATH